MLRPAPTGRDARHRVPSHWYNRPTSRSVTIHDQHGGTTARGQGHQTRSIRARPRAARAHPRCRLHDVRGARLPRRLDGRHRRSGRDVQGRRLLPLPDQGIDLPRADAHHRGQADRQGRTRGLGGDGPDRPGRDRDPDRAGDVCRPSDDGAPAVPGRHRGGARLPDRGQRAPRALRPPDPGYLDQAVSDGVIAPVDTRITSIAWFGALNEVVGRWLLAERPDRLEDAYPALRATLLRSVGVAEARIESVPSPEPRGSFPEAPR